MRTLASICSLPPWIRTGFRLLALGLSVVASVSAQPPTTADGFALPQPGHRFEFPRDHGSHPEFKIEWWYVTGHLFASPERRFGFQATFFRYAGPRTPGAAVTAGSDDIFLAHMAVTDVAELVFAPGGFGGEPVSTRRRRARRGGVPAGPHFHQAARGLR